MNLADAIRQAAQLSGTQALVQPTSLHLVETEPVVQEKEKKASAKAAESAPALSLSNSEYVPAQPVGNVVRLELFLSPEQLSSLFKAVVANQHSVMTTREAAAYLRLPIQKVEQMAIDKILPAMLIDGKWRFTHAALEEWLGLQQHSVHTHPIDPKIEEKGA